MCLAIPGQIVEVVDESNQLAKVDVAGVRRTVNIGLFAPLVGHVGDGNFHLAIMLDPHDPEQLARAKEFNDRLVRRAIAFDGTCTGEHGVGYGKSAFLELEHGPVAVGLMRAIKSALDPGNLFNPGKVAHGVRAE